MVSPSLLKFDLILRFSCVRVSSFINAFFPKQGRLRIDRHGSVKSSKNSLPRNGRRLSCRSDYLGQEKRKAEKMIFLSTMFRYIMPNFLFILTRFKKHDSLKMFLVVSNITFPHLFLFSVAQFDLWMVSVFFFK